MSVAYKTVSLLLALIGCGFIADSLSGWDNFAVVAASAGWAVALTGLLHTLVAFGAAGNEAPRWLAIGSCLVLLVLVAAGWVFASFSSEWPEIAAAACLLLTITLAIATRSANHGAT